MTTTKEDQIRAEFALPEPPTFYKGKFKGTNSRGMDCYSADWYDTKETTKYIENVETCAESYEKKLAEVQIAILEKAATMLDTRHLELIQKAKLPSQLVMELVEELRASNKGKD